MPTERTTASVSARPLLLVALGGFIGVICRHAIVRSLPGTIPWGTLLVNVLGSFALGVVLYEAHLAARLSPEARLVVGTGFLSSFTTYSTFAAETASLAPKLAVANVAVHYSLGIVGVLLGRSIARWAS